MTRKLKPEETQAGKAAIADEADAQSREAVRQTREESAKAAGDLDIAMQRYERAAVERGKPSLWARFWRWFWQG